MSTYKTIKYKYGKLPAKLAEEIPRNKLYVDIIGPYIIRRNSNKDNLNLKASRMMNTVTGRFEVAQYDDKIAITITTLVETTWLSRYHRTAEITYD